VRRGVIPVLFDQLTMMHLNRSGISFNLAGPGAMVGENLYLIRHFSSSEIGAQLKTVVIEWRDEYLPKSDNYTTERARYWMDFKSLKDQIYLLKGSPGLIQAHKEGKIFYVTSAFLLRNIGLRRISSDWTDTSVSERTKYDSRGYAGYEKLHATKPSSSAFIPRVPIYNPVLIGQNRENARRILYMNQIKPLPEDLVLWLDVIRQFSNRGIKVMLLIPPGPLTPRQIALMRQLPANNILDLSDPEKYPDLYDPAVYYDFVHFNKRGAELFTRHIAEALLKDHSRNH
jgi:hypothetical protein